MFVKLLSMFAPIALASSFAIAGPAGAQATDSPGGAMSPPAGMQSMENLPCEQVDGAMMSGMNEKSMMPASSGDIDKDFAGMMDMHATMMMTMAKLEIRCGKNEKVKEAAKRFVLNAPRTHRFSGESE